MQAKKNGATKPINKKNRKGWKKHVKYIFIFTFMAINLLSCNNNSNKNSNNNNINNNSDKNMNTTDSLGVKNVLSVQLKQGYYGSYGGKEALKALFSIADTILVNHGYNKPTVSEMKEKIKDVFGFYPFEPDPLISFIYRCNKPLREDNGTIMDIINDEVFEYREEIRIPIYISYEHQLITYAYSLPEIFDYKKNFPELLELENEPVYCETENDDGEVIIIEGDHWKDIPDLEKNRWGNRNLLVHLNMYIFNNSQSSLIWLMNNQPKFIEMLLKDYGYVKDKKMLKWLMDKHESIYNKSDDNYNNIEDYTRLLTYRGCDGKLVFHQEVLDLMTENLKKSYVDQILEYIRLDDDWEKKSVLAATFTFSEKAMVLAHLLYWAEKIAKERKYISQNDEHVMGAFYRYTDDREKYDEEFRRQNYYGLPDFEMLWEQGKIDGDGRTPPDYSGVFGQVVSDKKPKMLGGHILVDPY
jgi:hypothetical protein